MANLTASQKKSRNKFIALIIGIIIVAAACAYVIYGGVTAKSNLLENQNFAKALSEVTGKTPLAISENDLAAVKYLEMSYDSTNKQYSLAVGYDDFMAEYTKQLEAKNASDTASDETAADENTDANADNTAADAAVDNTADAANDTSSDKANDDSVDLSTLVKSAVFKGTEDDVFADLKYFTGVETISVHGVKFPADFDFGVYKNLTRGYFGNAGLSQTSTLKTLNLSTSQETQLRTGARLNPFPTRLPYSADTPSKQATTATISTFPTLRLLPTISKNRLTAQTMQLKMQMPQTVKTQTARTLPTIPTLPLTKQQMKTTLTLRRPTQSNRNTKI